MDCRHRIAFIGLLLVALLLRVGWGVSRGEEIELGLGDQFEYLSLGRHLLHEHELKFYDARFGQWIYSYRTPGYPGFVALCGGNVRVVQLAQALIDVSTVIAIYLLSKRSLVAAVVVVFNPFAIYFSALVLSETAFTAILAWGLYFLMGRKWVIAGLAMLALSVLIRPSAMGLVVLLGGAVAWPMGWRAVARNVAIGVGLVLVVLFPWAYRNAHHPHVGAWVWTTTNGGITLYDGFHDLAKGGSNQESFLNLKGMKTLLSRMDEVERDEFLAGEAHGWIRSHPGRSLELMVLKIARTWSPIPLSDEYGGNRLYVLVGLLYSVPFDALILLGLWKGALARSAKVLLLIPAIYFTGIHALSVGSLRYRLPAEPPMALIVGSWASYALGTRHGPSRRES